MIEIPASLTLSFEVPRHDQLTYDPLGSTLGDIQGSRNIAQADARISRDQ